ncbi:MAG: cytochrome c1 [Pseudomonadota bacterium]
MNKYITAIFFIVFSSQVMAASKTSPELAKYVAYTDISDQASLQRGAKYFVNYCLGCHSLEHASYERTGRDIGLTNDLIEKNLIFTKNKITDKIISAMDQQEAEQWLLAKPPDLTLVARARGTDWVYSYLMTFYKDENRPTGVNNWRYPNTAMPHVLLSLQGMQAANFVNTTDEDGITRKEIQSLSLIQDGSLTSQEYSIAVQDITNFLSYTAEPMQLERKSIGFWVLLFFIIFGLLGYFLKREFWKDLH